MHSAVFEQWDTSPCTQCTPHVCRVVGSTHRPKGGVHLPSLAAQHRLLCATVGGESICLVDVETGRVEMKYKEPGEVSRWTHSLL